jgi:spermidine synthase
MPVGPGTAQSRFDSPSWRATTLTYDADGLSADSLQVMQYWEQPLMERLAQYATRNRGRVLEIGFGLGISAQEIIKCGCDEYVVVEAHPEIAKQARAWGHRQSVPVTVVEDFWQNVLQDLGRFDGILFDTYLINDDPRSNNYYRFLPVAHHLLAPIGGITYYTEDTREFRAEHMALLLRHFDLIELSVVDKLAPPLTCRYWKHDHMVVPYVRSPRKT